MKSISLLTAVVLGALVVNGCAATLDRLHNLIASPADRYRKNAQAYEKLDEPQQALVCWEVTAELDKGDSQARKNIQALKNDALKAAQVHFQRGLGFYGSGDLNNALREFLIAIRLNPGHEQARDYLKNRLQNPEQATYQVQPGDSFTKIADTVYKDSTKAYLIAYFNDLDPNKPLLIGTTISLPAFEARYLVPRADIRDLLEKARAAYQKKNYDQVYELTESIQKEVPDHPKARDLADAAHFNQGQALMNQKQYLAAIEQFKQVSDHYKGRDRAIAKAHRQINRQAINEKLAAARKLLKNKAWPGVIDATEEILKQDPGNPEAKMLFSNASYNQGKMLLDRGETTKAVEILSRIEPSYEDTGQLLDLARARMKSQAETLYRDGVKQFINEDLEMAIKTWKKALELNPQHVKARQDMANAQRLLEKLRALDKEPEKPAP
jgi:tetratricopeptide (TPR) repeat protein